MNCNNLHQNLWKFTAAPQFVNITLQITHLWWTLFQWTSLCPSIVSTYLSLSTPSQPLQPNLQVWVQYRKIYSSVNIKDIPQLMNQQACLDITLIFLEDFFLILLNSIDIQPHLRIAFWIGNCGVHCILNGITFQWLYCIDSVQTNWVGNLFFKAKVVKVIFSELLYRLRWLLLFACKLP